MTRAFPGGFPAAPAEPVAADGAARLGLYRGGFERIDWSARLGRLRRLVKQKRWLYACVATPEVLAGAAIVDLGYAANAFVFAVDLAKGGMIASDSFLGVPGLSAVVDDRLGDGASCRFDAPGARFRMRRAAGAWSIEARSGTLALEARLDPGPPPAAIVMEVRDGVTATQKSNLLPATGSLRAGGRRFDLGGGFGGLDHSSGLLPRETTWRWAFALGRAPDGTPVGFNLSDGLSTTPGAENVLWRGDRLTAVGPARFDFDARRPEAPWHVRTDDGGLDLRFTSAGVHREERNLGVARSRFAHVVGRFSGRIGDLDVEGLPGITEDQFVRW